MANGRWGPDESGNDRSGGYLFFRIFRLFLRQLTDRLWWTDQKHACGDRCSKPFHSFFTQPSVSSAPSVRGRINCMPAATVRCIFFCSFSALSAPFCGLSQFVLDGPNESCNDRAGSYLSFLLFERDIIEKVYCIEFLFCKIYIVE